METCGVILAGGKSTRMGTNKALLKIDNRTVIEKVASELQLVCDKVIIVTNVPDDYRFLDFDLIGDRKSTRLNSSHVSISYAVFCLKKKKTNKQNNKLTHQL